MTESESDGLTPETFKRKRNAKLMLERIGKVGPLLELSLVASGGSSYNTLRDLRNWGLAVRCEHPSVKDSGGWPADAIAITDAGKKMLKDSA
jgi:hypothetical protein